MANEFKIRKGLIVEGASGGTVVDIQGSQGQLFSVTDDLSGSIFAVSDISGVPIFNVNSSGLSTFDGNVNLPDNKKILLGTGSDLEIYHNGNDSYIKDAGTGDLRIVASATKIYDADMSHLQASFTDGGSVDLYYGGNKKFETASTGVSVTGNGIFTGNVGIGVTSPQSKLHVAHPGNVNGGTILMGATGSGTNKWSYLVGAHYNQSSGSGNGAGSAGVALIGSFNNSTTNNVYIGGGPYEINAATSIDFYTNPTNLSTAGGVKRMQISGAGMVTFNTYSGTSFTGGTPTYLLSTDASGNIIKTNTVPGSAAGPYLPLAGGTVTGNLTTNGIFTIQNAAPYIQWKDVAGTRLGYIQHNATNLVMSADTGQIQFDTTANNDILINPGGTGKVGIGTTSPGAMLEVNGNIKLSSTAGQTATPSNIWLGNDYSNGTTRDKLKIYLYNSGTEQYGFTVGNQSDIQYHSNQEHDFYVANSIKVRISQSGNVGIGTTGPTDKLEVNGNLSIFGNKIYNGSASNSAGVSFPNSTTRIDGYNGITFHSSATTVGSQSERMRITNAGNVGIGTTSPGFPLTISGGGANTNPGTAEANYIGEELAFKIENPGFSATNGLIRMVQPAGAYVNNSCMTFSTIQGTLTEKMRITQGGNVGIGTTTPNAKLDIQGTQGQLFSVTDDLSGEIFAVADISGVPIMTVNSSGVSYFDGNVGIGTTSPATELHVESDNPIITLQRNNNGNASGAVQFRGSDNVVDWQVGTNQVVGLGLEFNFQNSNKVYIETGGNVGIGTTNPQLKLHVNGTNASVGTIGTPKSDWYTTAYNGIQVGDGTTLWGRAADSHFSGNYYVKNNGGSAQDTYINALSANDLWLDNSSGSLKYRNASLGGAGNAITWNTRFVVLTNGNFGIGTTDPIYKLDVVSTSAGVLSLTGVDKPVIRLRVGTSTIATMQAQENTSFNINAHGTSSLNLQTAGTSPRLTILTGGNVGIGTTSPGSLLEIEGATNSSTSNLLRLSRASQGSTPEKVAGFYSGTSGEKGYITVNNFGTAYNTSSDYRLKENIKPIDNSVERLMSLKPCNFNFISEDEDKVVMDGFIAHEAKEVVPEAVTGVKDAVDEEGKPAYQGIDQSKLVPLLTAALQEALQRIEILEQKINN